MRYLKRQTLDRRSANNTTLYSDAARTNITMAPVGAGNLYLQAMNGAVQLPTGSNAQQPAGANGMMRYNTDVVTGGRVEVYSAGRWRALSFVEQKQITQQNLGAGDGNNTYFGPLNSTYYNPGNNANNATVGAQNILVVVENVLQLSGINYSVVQNPTISAETYTGSLSVAASSGSSILYFNTSLNVTTASWTSNVATVTVSNTTSSQPGFAIGATITVADIRSTGQTTSAFNGVFTVTGSTATTVTYALTTNPGTYQNGGSVTASGSTPAIFPAVSLTGAVVSGSNIYSGALVTGSAITDPNTGALTSISMNHAPTGSIAVNTIAITITEAQQTISNNSYYLKFSTPVPYGKTVIALIGFDQ